MVHLSILCAAVQPVQTEYQFTSAYIKWYRWIHIATNVALASHASQTSAMPPPGCLILTLSSLVIGIITLSRKDCTIATILILLVVLTLQHPWPVNLWLSSIRQ